MTKVTMAAPSKSGAKLGMPTRRNSPAILIHAACLLQRLG